MRNIGKISLNSIYYNLKIHNIALSSSKLDRIQSVKHSIPTKFCFSTEPIQNFEGLR